MEILFLPPFVVEIISILALLLAIYALVKAASSRREVKKFILEEEAFRYIRKELGKDLREIKAKLSSALAPGFPEVKEAAQSLNAVVESTIWKTLSPADGYSLYESEPDLVVLDVRTSAEWGQGHLPRAVHLPLDKLEKDPKSIGEVSGKVLVYCASGSRSAAASDILTKNGYKEVYNLKGGVNSWPGEILRDTP